LPLMHRPPPTPTLFPYTTLFRSQASICASTLSLMDAGVPIKAPVAGISCGLITEGDRWMTMVDIQGLEDFFGDMDFKVGGTHKRSEEHTSELQSRFDLVCRLLLE